MSKSSILVVAKDAVISALMGALVELSGHRPIFPADDEQPLEAITRIRPSLVLLDCEHDLACEDEAYRRAEAVGARALLFSAARTEHEARELAARRGLSAFALPIRYHDFRRELESALSG